MEMPPLEKIEETMSEETHEDKNAVDVEGQSKPRRRRRRSRNAEGGSAEQNATSQANASASEDAPRAAAASSPDAKSGGEQQQAAGQAGEEGATKSKRRRRRKSRSKRQAEQQASGDGKQQEAKKGGGQQQGGSHRSQSQQNRPKQQAPRQRPKPPPQEHVYRPLTPESKFGGREPLVSPDFEEERSNEPLALTPFELFCAYHLGISDDNRYRPPNIREVARRFDVSQGEIEQALKRFGLDRDAVRKIGYDMSLAQLDMQVAPEGIDKRELAKVLFSELVEMSPAVQQGVAMAEKLAEAAAQEQANAQIAEEQRVED